MRPGERPYEAKEPWTKPLGVSTLSGQLDMDDCTKKAERKGLNEEKDVTEPRKENIFQEL